MRGKMGKLLSTAATVAVIAGMLLVGARMILREYVFWNGMLLPRDAQSLTVSGKKMRNPEAFLEFTDLRQLDARDTDMTVRQYEWFRQAMPGCSVLWEVPVQGRYYPQDTTGIQAEQLTDEDMDALRYLPALQTMDVGDWTDYARIQALKQQYPDCDVRYQVPVAGEWWASDAVSMALENADAAELAEKLGLFDDLESVLLTGKIPEQSEMQALQAEYPDISFLWKMNIFGMDLETDLETLDLPDGTIDSVAELEKLLPYFPKLRTVRLSSLRLPQEELVALAEQHPEIRFLFELTLGDHILSTDAEEIDISNTPLEDTSTVEAILPCFHDLKKVVMCDCGISSEDMDALNRKYEDIRFVWSVDLAGMPFRTDAIHFTPNRWGLKCTNENIDDLRYCTDMVCVDIGHAIRVTNCDWVRNMPNLKYLILAETGISDLTPLEGMENLIFLELFLCKAKDYTPLTTCKALEDLNLCYTYGDPEPIGEMTWLKRLWWSGRWVARKTLPDKLTDTQMDFGGGSSTGRGWREGQHYYDMRDFIGMEYMTG